MNKRTVTVALCDHQCHPMGELDYAGLRERLRETDSVSEVVLLERACDCEQKDLPSTAGGAVICAACPALERYLDFGEGYVVADTRSAVFDTYEGAAALEENLYRKLVSLSILYGSGELIPEERISFAGKVLVIGGGFSATATALRLDQAGFSVEINGEPAPFYSPGCRHLSLSSPDLETELLSQTEAAAHINRGSLAEICEVFQGEEDVAIRTADGLTHRYGAVVIAPEYIETGDPGAGGSNLSRLYDQISAGEDLRGDTCFILDHGGETRPEVFLDVLRATLHIIEKHRGEVTILLRNARVSADDGQRVYDECREAGAIFLRYGDELNIRNDYGDFVIEGMDPQTSAGFSISRPDRVVIPGKPRLSESIVQTMADLRLKAVGDSFSQADSLWLLPNATNRPFVFAAGASRSSLEVEQILRDVDSVSTSVARLYSKEGLAVGEHIPVIDQGKCIRCLTCVRTCPFRALQKTRLHRAAELFKAACKGCGLCAAACPAGAIELRNLGREAVTASLQALAGPRPETATGAQDSSPGGLLVIHCAEGGQQAVEAMRRQGRKLPGDVRFFELPCSGRIEESSLLDTVRAGCDGILVVGCRKDNCKYLDGNARAERKLSRVDRILTEAGIDGVCTEMLFVAPDEGRRLFDAIGGMHLKLNDLAETRETR